MSNTRIASVTLIGQKHINREVPCEDYSLAVVKNDVSVVALSDGAGSKKYTHARFGSQIACETVVDIVTKHFDAIYYENREAAVKSLLVAAINSRMADFIAKENVDSIERLSCTLLFCAVKDRRMICGHIGDGLIARVSSSGLSPITMPQNDLHEASATYFITAPHASDYLRIIRTTIDDIHGIALMTDGVQDMVYDEQSGLVRPVICKMVDTLKTSREECERNIEDILAKYVVGASNVSDDASFGIVYFDGTKSPNPDELMASAPSFGRSDDSFKKLQDEWIDSVRRAKEIITSSKNSSDIQNSSSKIDNEDSNISEEEGRSKLKLIVICATILLVLITLICFFLLR